MAHCMHVCIRLLNSVTEGLFAEHVLNLIKQKIWIIVNVYSSRAYY
jgi:hypothetical protein